jgi:hypothetical protein
MATNDSTLRSSSKSPDFVLTHWGKRFWLVAMTSAARQWLRVNRTEVLDPELPVQVGETWAMELMGDVYWSQQPLNVLVEHSPHPHGVQRA